MKTIRYNVDNQINFSIDEKNGDMLIEANQPVNIIVPAKIAQELLHTLRAKQYEVFESHKQSWFKDIFK
jgi:hypothetical protein